MRLLDHPDPTGTHLRASALAILVDPTRHDDLPQATAALLRLSGVLWPEAVPLFTRAPEIIWTDERQAVVRHAVAGTDNGYHDIVLDDAALVAMAFLQVGRRAPLDDPAWFRAQGYDPRRIVDIAGLWLRVAGRPEWVARHLTREQLPAYVAQPPVPNPWLGALTAPLALQPQPIERLRKGTMDRPARSTTVLQDIHEAFQAVRSAFNDTRDHSSQVRRDAMVVAIQDQQRKLCRTLGVDGTVPLADIARLGDDRAALDEGVNATRCCAAAIMVLAYLADVAALVKASWPRGARKPSSAQAGIRQRGGAKRATSTIIAVLGDLNFAIGHLGSLPLERWTVHAFQAALDAGDYADSTQHRRWTTARGLTRFLARHQVRLPLSYATRQGVIVREPERLLQPAQYEWLFQQLGAYHRTGIEPERAGDLQVLFALCHLFGLRISEALSRRVSHLEPSLAAVYIEKSAAKSHRDSIRSLGLGLASAERILGERVARCVQTANETGIDVSLFDCGDSPARLRALGRCFARQLNAYGQHAHSLRHLHISLDAACVVAFETGMVREIVVERDVALNSAYDIISTHGEDEAAALLRDTERGQRRGAKDMNDARPPTQSRRATRSTAKPTMDEVRQESTGTALASLREAHDQISVKEMVSDRNQESGTPIITAPSSRTTYGPNPLVGPTVFVDRDELAILRLYDNTHRAAITDVWDALQQDIQTIGARLKRSTQADVKE